MPEINYNTNYTIINLPIAIFSMLFLSFSRSRLRFLLVTLFEWLNSAFEMMLIKMSARRLAAVGSALENTCSSEIIAMTTGAEREKVRQEQWEMTIFTMRSALYPQCKCDFIAKQLRGIYTAKQENMKGTECCANSDHSAQITRGSERRVHQSIKDLNASTFRRSR